MKKVLLMCCLSSAFVALLQAQTDSRNGNNSNNSQLQYNKASDDLTGGGINPTKVNKPEVERKVNQFSDDHPASYTTMQREKAKNSTSNPYYRDGQQYSGSNNVAMDNNAPYKEGKVQISKDTIPLKEKTAEVKKDVNQKTTEIKTDLKDTTKEWENSVVQEVDEIDGDINNTKKRNGLIKSVSDEESADRPINRLFMTTAEYKVHKQKLDDERQLKMAAISKSKDEINDDIRKSAGINQERLDSFPRNTVHNSYYNTSYPSSQQQPQQQQQGYYGYTQPSSQNWQQSQQNDDQNRQLKSSQIGNQQYQQGLQYPSYTQDGQWQNPQQYQGQQGQYSQPQYGYYSQPNQYQQPQDMQQRSWKNQQHLGYQQQPSVQGQLPQQQYGYSSDYMHQQNIPYQQQIMGQPSQQMGMHKSGAISQNEIYGPYQQNQVRYYQQPQQLGYYQQGQQQFNGRMQQQDFCAYCYNAQQQSYNTSMTPYSSMRQPYQQQMHQPSYGYSDPRMMQQDYYQSSGLRERQDLYQPAAYTKSQGISSQQQYYGIPSSYNRQDRFDVQNQERNYYQSMQGMRYGQEGEDEYSARQFRPVQAEYNSYANLSKRERRRLQKRFPNGITSNREAGYLYANPDNAEKVFTVRDLEKRMDGRTTMGKVQESKIAVDNYVFPSTSIVVDGKTNKVQRKWRKFLKEESGVKIKRQRLKNTAYNKDKNARYFKAEAVRLNEVTDKPGDVLTVFQKEKGHTRMDVAYKLGYQVALSPEDSKREFRNLESLVKRFNATNFSANSKEYTKTLERQIKATNKDLKREERRLSKMERTYNKRNKKGKADSYEALAVDLQRKTTESLKKDIATFEYMKMDQKNRANDIHLDRLHRN